MGSPRPGQDPFIGSLSRRRGARRFSSAILRSMSAQSSVSITVRHSRNVSLKVTSVPSVARRIRSKTSDSVLITVSTLNRGFEILVLDRESLDSGGHEEWFPLENRSL
jgi:hypothetical protein